MNDERTNEGLARDICSVIPDWYCSATDCEECVVHALRRRADESELEVAVMRRAVAVEVSDRQTGRSTNGLRAALEYSNFTGNHAVYVVSDLQQVKYMRALLKHIGGTIDDNMVSIVTVDYDFRGYHHEQVFVDHHALEAGIRNPALQELLGWRRE